MSFRHSGQVPKSADTLFAHGVHRHWCPQHRMTQASSDMQTTQLSAVLKSGEWDPETELDTEHYSLILACVFQEQLPIEMSYSCSCIGEKSSFFHSIINGSNVLWVGGNEMSTRVLLGNTHPGCRWWEDSDWGCSQTVQKMLVFSDMRRCGRISWYETEPFSLSLKERGTPPM